MTEHEANSAPDPDPIDYPHLVLSLEATIESLTRENARLEAKLLREASTLTAFLIKLYGRMGRMYGWKTALVEASHSPGLDPIELGMIKQWTKTSSVPAWAFKQLDQMVFKPRTRRERQVIWTEKEKDFLIETHVQQPRLTNNQLADACSRKFNRRINDNAIRGQLSRVRQEKRVPWINRPQGRVNT